MKKRERKQYHNISVKRRSKKGTFVFAFLFSTVLLVLLFNFFTLFNVKQSQTVYEADLAVTESLGDGFTTPTFTVDRGDRIHIYITEFYSSEGYSLVAMLQGMGIEWQQVITEENQYKILIEENGMYSLELAINNFNPIEGAEIKLHIKIMLA